jgi:hypothetical protein
LYKVASVLVTCAKQWSELKAWQYDSQSRVISSVSFAQLTCKLAWIVHRMWLKASVAKTV